MIDRMDTPSTRAEFERRFSVLREQMMNGRLHFARGIDTFSLGLLELRYLPNGRMDFLSVNESARLQANMAAHMERMPETILGMSGTRSEEDLGRETENVAKDNSEQKEAPQKGKKKNRRKPRNKPRGKKGGKSEPPTPVNKPKRKKGKRNK